MWDMRSEEGEAQTALECRKCAFPLWQCFQMFELAAGRSFWKAELC